MTTLTIILLILGWLVLGFLSTLLGIKKCEHPEFFNNLAGVLFFSILGGITTVLVLIILFVENNSKFWSKKAFSILLIVGGLVLSSCNIEGKLKELAEVAYFEGQRDAIHGDIRIKLNSDSIYIWIKSPWYGTDWENKPIQYYPDYLDSRNH